MPFINLNFPPSSGAKKGSDECHFYHFTNIFWVKRTFNCLQCRFILLIQKNGKINILSMPFMSFTGNKSSGAILGSHKWHFDHFTNIFWVKRTFKVNSVQEACAKFFVVHILKFEILQTTWKNKTTKHQNARSIDEILKTKSLMFIVSFFSLDLQDFKF